MKVVNVLSFACIHIVTKLAVMTIMFFLLNNYILKYR